MVIRETRAAGLGYLALATELLHRARLADPTAGLWEAADVHWWWRSPRSSDLIEQLFWVDGDGPVAAVLLTDWGRVWGCDPIVVPHMSEAPLSVVCSRALDLIETLPLATAEVLARDDDAGMLAILADAGFAATEERSGVTWMASADRPAVPAVPEGFRLVDRAQSADRPHPMQGRNGGDVEGRLRQCSLYDPELDLAVEAPNGDIAAYALFWFDPVTGVGMVEPMRTEDQYQRRGLARVLLAAGLDCLAARGAQRLKVGYDTEAARNLYVGVGFRVTATSRTYQRK
jgi:GNAT superfamily N-acetyltransferase